MEPEEQPLPTLLSPGLRARQLWIMASLLPVALSSLALTFCGLQWGLPHYHESIFLKNHFLFVVLFLIAALVAATLTKYVWLFGLSRVVGMAEVSPYVAYGFPRRIHRLDHALLKKFYKR